MGPVAARTLLVTAATQFMAGKRVGDTEVRQWAQRVEERRGRGKARIALARKRATIMIAMWKSGERYRNIPPVRGKDTASVSGSGLDLVTSADPAQACGSCSETRPEQRRGRLGPGRPLFYVTRHASHHKMQTDLLAARAQRQLSSANFVLTG